MSRVINPPDRPAHDPAVPTLPAIDPAPLEHAETTSVTLEWRVGGLRGVFEGSRGEGKSKCIKSAVFGDPDNLWELLFYGNSGPTAASASNQSAPSAGSAPTTTPAGEYASFYLSAVPTQEERDGAVRGKWARKGLYAFRFEIRTVNKATVIASKEATNHVFSSKTVNWGWQSFARRDTLYFAQPAVKSADAFLVCCTVAAYPTPPAGYWLAPHLAPGTLSGGAGPDAAPAWAGSVGGWKGIAGGNGAMATDGARALVPRSLVGAFGALFDDRAYSDVAFLLPRRGRRRAGARGEQGVKREDELESRPPSSLEVTSPAHGHGAHEAQTDEAGGSGGGSAYGSLPSAHEYGFPARDEGSTVRGSASRAAGRTPYRTVWAIKKVLRRADYFVGMFDAGFAHARREEEEDADDSHSAHDSTAGDDSDMEEERLFSDLDSEDGDGEDDEDDALAPDDGPKKTEVVITEAAHRTWRALIYYLYTDTITFAPLASSFIPAASITPDTPRSGAKSGGSAASTSAVPPPEVPARGRREWIRTWLAEHHAEKGRPAPCSAKAIYRLADKFDLPSLRQRAFQHIVSQLTVQNIPYEAFSSFSATFEEVRKIEVAFFLAHWNELKGSQAMANIWQHIRMGRHLGFEEVWPSIVSNLEFKATRDESAAQTVSSHREDLA